MKIEKFKYILPIIIISILGISTKVYAKTSIEIKPSSTVYTNKTISEFFDESMAMKNVGEGLEGSNVDVHMATNTDWAIFAYFSNSQYGTGGEGKNNGIATSINGTSYLSTNGNITGMMNLGKTHTYTSGIISKFEEIEESSTVYSNGKSIIANATNKKYVDLINTAAEKDMGKRAWYGNWYGIGNSKERPYSIRSGLFYLTGGGGNFLGGYKTDGAASTNYTFRPVIWN